MNAVLHGEHLAKRTRMPLLVKRLIRLTDAQSDTRYQMQSLLENREPAGVWQQGEITTFEISDRRHRRCALARLIKLRLLPFMRRQKLKWRAAATRECPRTEEHFAIRFRDNIIPLPPKRGEEDEGTFQRCENSRNTAERPPPATARWRVKQLDNK